MKIRIEKIEKEEPEEVVLRVHEVNADVLAIANQFEKVGHELVGYKNNTVHPLLFSEVYYFEVVEGKSFLYCNSEVYESPLRLYEFQKLTLGNMFFRASKSMVVNADKIDHIVPSMYGRFEAVLINGERVVVNRNYVDDMKRIFGM